MALRRKINSDYLSIFNELPLFCGIILRNALRKKGPGGSGAVLIANSCLVGEFAASVPAMREYIKQQSEPVDVVVSPLVRPLAEHLKGVRRVYTAKSVFNRASESNSDAQALGSYERIVVLRASPEIFRLLGKTNARHVKTALRHFFAYGLHLGWNLARGVTPKPWREVNVSVLQTSRAQLSFNDMFDISAAEVEHVRALPALAGPKKKILIHTGASWTMNCWHLKNWIELLARLHASGEYDFIFIGAEKDKKEYLRIAAALPFPVRSLIAEINLWELLLVMRECHYFIGVDSGPRNLAHLAELPSVTLLGPAPHMYTPPDPRDIVIDHSGGRGLFERFFERKESLINTISPQEVLEAFARLSITG